MAEIGDMKEFLSLLRKVLNKIRHMSCFMEEKQASLLKTMSHDFTKATSAKSLLTDL